MSALLALASILPFAGHYVRNQHAEPEPKRLPENVVALMPAEGAPREVVGPCQAVDEFLAMLVEHGGGGELWWQRIRHSYDQLAPENGWPDLTDKTLALLLKARGCRAVEVDRRSASRGAKGRAKLYYLPISCDLDETFDLPEAA